MKDFEYLLPQLAVIYYAGQWGMKVIPDSEDPVGIPVTACIPDLNLVIDVTNHPKEIRVKQQICEVNGIKYVNLPEKLPETEVITRIRKNLCRIPYLFDVQPFRRSGKDQ